MPKRHNGSEEKWTTMDTDMVLGLLLQDFRVRAGMTCQMAASRSRISVARLTAVEEGDGELFFGDLVALLALYRIGLRQFVRAFQTHMRAFEPGPASRQRGRQLPPPRGRQHRIVH
jgi:hypothetical protein